MGDPMDLFYFLCTFCTFVVGVVVGGYGVGTLSKKQPPKPLDECGVHDCYNVRDPRCRGLNCTECCASILRCDGICFLPPESVSLPELVDKVAGPEPESEPEPRSRWERLVEDDDAVV